MLAASTAMEDEAVGDISSPLEANTCDQVAQEIVEHKNKINLSK
jgi:hypothetical protein